MSQIDNEKVDRKDIFIFIVILLIWCYIKYIVSHTNCFYIIRNLCDNSLSKNNI